MTILEFSLDLPSHPDQLMKLSEDYENLPRYLPDQLKSVKIIEKNETETITEETIVFITLLKKNIVQNQILDSILLHFEFLKSRWNNVCHDQVCPQHTLLDH